MKNSSLTKPQSLLIQIFFFFLSKVVLLWRLILNNADWTFSLSHCILFDSSVAQPWSVAFSRDDYLTACCYCMRYWYNLAEPSVDFLAISLMLK